MVKRIEGASVELLDAADVDDCPLLAAWELPSAPAYHYMRRVHIKDACASPTSNLSDRIIYDQAPERFNATTVIPVMDELRVNVSKARQELTIGGASPEVAQHLGIACGAPVALVRRYACDDSGKAIYAAWLCIPATGCASTLIWCVEREERPHTRKKPAVSAPTGSCVEDGL